MQDKVIVAVQLLKVQAESLQSLLMNGELHGHGIVDVDQVSTLEGEGIRNFHRLLNPGGILDLQNALEKKRKAFILDIKRKLAKNIETAIDELGARLNPHSRTFNEYILLSEKFHRINSNFLTNLVSFDDANREISKISNSIILILDELSGEDLLF
jgi:hypothetical protein